MITAKPPAPLTELQRHVLDYLHVFLKEPIGTLTIIHHKGREDFEVNYYGSLPAGYYDLYTAPQSSQPERAMVTPWITKDKLDRAFPVDQFAAKAQQPAPAWHDAPTEPGDWILSTACGLEVHQGIKQHELDNGELWPGSRWFGPIPEYQK